MTSDTAAEPAGHVAMLLHRLGAWGSRVGLGRKLVVALLIASAAAGIATYVILTQSAPASPDPTAVLVILNIDLALMLVLAVIVARRVVAVWVARRRGSAGSRLHTRLVLLFGLVAATPAVIVAIFSVLFLDLGMQAWFSDRVRTALRESVAVAEAYLHEHQQNIRADVLAMASDISREGPTLMSNPKRFNQIVTTQAALRSLSEAVVFDSTGRVMARAGFSFALEFEPLPNWALEKAMADEVAVMTSEGDDRVRALVRLNGFVDTFLYVGRLVDAKVLSHMETTQRAVSAYEKLEGRRSGLQITFAMIFGMVALLLLLAAVLVGLNFANQLVRPVSRLIEAAEKVRGGDLTARVEEGPQGDELGSLSRAFNRMTSQIGAQQSELMEANRQLDLRRRFTEVVLSGVSAGVIGLDQSGRVNLPNRSATQFLGMEPEQMMGRQLGDLVPEMGALMRKARRRPQKRVEAQVSVAAGGLPRTLLVRIAAEKMGEEVLGFVVTFDDVTELLSAQRKAAWADVARRIAHEIKNPLTPIQLSAERLKRRYLKEIKSDPETFIICTDTIVRQVSDIGRMVDEFSSFARMPAPVMADENMAELCRQAVFLQTTAHPDVEFASELPDGPVIVQCDGRQVGRALTNLLQNAAESIEGLDPAQRANGAQGKVTLRLTCHNDRTIVVVEDNGRGFPKALLARLTEPYVTTRAKGTGLGLAIVKKIMEDHQGELVLGDRDGGGAAVTLVFRNHIEGAAEPLEDETGEPARVDETAKIAAHGS
ncbi:MAG: PAS domain-containing sensor histidine kinase [Alphaproteobacteria bacterium]